MASAIERYLEELRAELRHEPLLARRLCGQVADHLAEITASERSRSMSASDCHEAVTSMLAAADAGRHFEGYLRLMGVALAGRGLCALAYTTLTALISHSVRAA